MVIQLGRWPVATIVRNQFPDRRVIVEQQEKEAIREAAEKAERERQAQLDAQKINTLQTASMQTTGIFDVWDQLSYCESGGQWNLNSGNGFYGGLQFSLSTWQAYGGTGFPHQHTRETQIAVAERLRAARGYQPWPSCAAQLGLT